VIQAAVCTAFKDNTSVWMQVRAVNADSGDRREPAHTSVVNTDPMLTEL
jgi:hypothetical protein